MDTNCDNKINYSEFKNNISNLIDFGYNPFKKANKEINIQIPKIEDIPTDADLDNENTDDEFEMDESKQEEILFEEYKAIDVSAGGMGELTFFEFANWALDKGLRLRNVLPCTDTEEVDYENGD